MKEGNEAGRKRRFRLGKSVRKAKWHDALSWNDNQMCIFLSFAKSGFINADSRSILCLHSPVFPPRCSAAVLGSYICLPCYVPGIKSRKLLRIVKRLFRSFSFSVRPRESMLCQWRWERGRRAECLSSRCGKKLACAVASFFFLTTDHRIHLVVKTH